MACPGSMRPGFPGVRFFMVPDEFNGSYILRSGKLTVYFVTRKEREIGKAGYIQLEKLWSHSDHIPVYPRNRKIYREYSSVILRNHVPGLYLSAELFCMKGIMDSKGVLGVKRKKMWRLRYNVSSGPV